MDVFWILRSFALPARSPCRPSADWIVAKGTTHDGEGSVCFSN